MSAISSKGFPDETRRDRDPRVVRSREATLDAARSLFLDQGYAGTTMDEIAAAAGLTKRTLYNNYPDKETIFKHAVEDIMKFAGNFARGLEDRFSVVTSCDLLERTFYDLADELALSIIRIEVVAIRRLLIGEIRTFPAMASEYFDAAPGQVIAALSKGFERLARIELLRISQPKRAAAQFAYLIAGEHLDRAILTGTVPPKKEIVACARDGVETFLARYAVWPADRSISKRTS